jgi:hypothetical protein
MKYLVNVTREVCLETEDRITVDAETPDEAAEAAVAMMQQTSAGEPYEADAHYTTEVLPAHINVRTTALEPAILLQTGKLWPPDRPSRKGPVYSLLPTLFEAEPGPLPYILLTNGQRLVCCTSEEWAAGVSRAEC